MPDVPIDQLSGDAGSAADLFLHVKVKRVGKIKGEASTEGHVDDIELRGWTWGAQAGDAMGSSAATARRQYRPLVITKDIDSASVGLLSALAKNDEVVEAHLTMRKAGGEALAYYSLKLGGARVADIGYQVDAAGRTVERVVFTFTRFDVEYKRQEGTGGGSGGIAFSDEVLPAGGG